MGYMKRIADEDQARVDQIVRWWQSHENVNTPWYLMNAVVQDQKFFDKVVTEWEAEVPPPVPASRHVSLQEERLMKKRRREATWSLTGDEVKIFMSVWVMGLLAMIITLAVLGMEMN